MPTKNSGQVNTATKEGVTAYALVAMNTQQTANLAVGDHVKFDTVLGSRGPEIVPDTTDAYATTLGAAALGRFLLKAGQTYHLTASMPYVLASGATGVLEFGWYDATAGAWLTGSRGYVNVASGATNDGGDGNAEAIFTPTQDTYVEVQLAVATAITQLGTTNARTPVAFIETM